MDISVSQRDALSHAREILMNAGLSTAGLDISHTSPFSPSALLSSGSSPYRHSSLLPSNDSREVSLSVHGSCYIPPPARPYSPNGIAEGRNRINRVLTANAVIEHPANVIIKYPQTGTFDSKRITHVFTINTDPSACYDSPQSSFQYSLGNDHGGRKGVKCHLIRDDAGDPIRCDHLHTSCKFLFFTVISHTDNGLQAGDSRYVPCVISPS